MKKTNLEKESDKNNIALFKYAIIAPLINETIEYPSKEAFYRAAAEKKYKLPNGQEVIVTAGTIKRWYLDYKKNGYESLKPKSRTDEGFSRKIPIDCINNILEIKEKYPHITGKAIYKKMIEEGYIDKSKVSVASLYRFLNNNKLHEREVVERRAFEMEFANDCCYPNLFKIPTFLIKTLYFKEI